MTSLADWDEVKRLAADFQKAQLSSTTQRLSERNCIEIVTKLIELKLIDVIFTNDGKEYLTSQQLVKEIKDEIYVQGGRINTVNLAKELNVDLSQIEANISQVTHDKSVILVSGCLISNGYIEKLATELNERLIQQGQINVGELTLQYELPVEFLQQKVLVQNLGKIIQGRQDSSDPRVFYTESFIARAKGKIRGALIGLLKPTPVAAILNRCDLKEKLFHSLLDQMKMPGAVTGKEGEAIYIPHCHTKSQINWVTSFFKQNMYLEYDAVARLGISDPQSFIKGTLPEENLLFLQTCAAGPSIVELVENALEECIATKSFVDVTTLLPSVFSDSDLETILEKILKNKQKSIVLFDATVLSSSYLEQLQSSLIPMAETKAEAAVKSGVYQQYIIDKQLANRLPDTAHHQNIDYKAERRDERRKKASSGKSGGGSQGRETKTKSVKKHSRSSKNATHNSDSDDNDNVVTSKSSGVFEIVSIEDIEKSLIKVLEEEGIDYLGERIAKYMQVNLNQRALATAKELSDKVLQSETQNRKQTHSSVQEKINVVINDIRLYEKGIKLLPAHDQPQFVKYLLKTLGVDIANELCKYVASQCNLQVPMDVLSNEQRNKIVNDSSDEFKGPLKSLNLSVTSAEQTIEGFLQALDDCLAACGMILKKVDKKKDKIILQNHKDALLEELAACEDPALALHLASLALYSAATQTLLHASGRQVSSILAFLQPHLKEEQRNQLTLYHDLVLKYLKTDELDRKELEDQLKTQMTTVKTIAKEYKKSEKLII